MIRKHEPPYCPLVPTAHVSCCKEECAWWVAYEGDNWSKEGCALLIIAESTLSEK